MMRFSEFSAIVRATLGLPPEARLEIVPGPEMSGSSDRFVVLTSIPAPGLQVEGLIDAVGWQVEVVGDQNDYATSEEMAFQIDTGLLSLRSGMHEGNWVVGIDRVGSPPVPLFVDDADRTHFVCSYVATVKSALARKETA